jgi:hypothetical protein
LGTHLNKTALKINHFGSQLDIKVMAIKSYLLVDFCPYQVISEHFDGCSSPILTTEPNPMIQGFPANASIYPGETITLYVSTDAPKFRIGFYRQGVTLQFQFSSEILPGTYVADHGNDEDWTVDWPPFNIQISGDVRPGAYIAMFIECDEKGNPNPNQDPPLNIANSYAPTGKAFFVIKNPNSGYDSQLLYKLPLFTYHAYNKTGGNSVYQQAAVSLHRPGGGTGGLPWDGTYSAGYPYGDWDPFDNYALDPVNLSPRQVFEHWDAKFISFLESNGYRTDYCTDMDIHQDDNLELMKNYAVLLSVGHDEYYSVPMRRNIEAFRSQGGNIAFLSGNICWWQVLFLDADETLMAPQSPGQNGMHYWFQQGAGLPNNAEDSLTGVSFRNAAGRYKTTAPTEPTAADRAGYTVQFTNQWPFENTGLHDGQTFGKNLGLVGYECDGTFFDKSHHPSQPAFQSGDNTPLGFTILGTCDVSGFSDPGNDWPAIGDQTEGNAAATMGIYRQNGTVFTAATTDWPRVTWAGEKSTIQITKNVLNRLGGNPKGLTNLFKIEDAFCIDGFYSRDDQFRHAIVGAKDGSITEIFFNPAPGEGLGSTELLAVEGLTDLGAFYTSDDKMRHVLALSERGDITEIYYNPDNTGVSATSLPPVPNAFRIAGFFSNDDGFRHAICATTDGNVIDLRYGTGEPTQTTLLSVAGIIDIGCFYSKDDKLGHVIVATSDGIITEIYYNSRYNVSRTPIGNIDGPARVTAFYADDDKFFNRRAQVLSSDGRLHEIRYGLQTDTLHVVLIALSDINDFGGFYSADDHFRHAVVLSNDGQVRELFFNP